MIFLSTSIDYLKEIINKSLTIFSLFDTGTEHDHFNRKCAEDIDELLNKDFDSLYIVSQTTFNENKFDKLVADVTKNIENYDMSSEPESQIEHIDEVTDAINITATNINQEEPKESAQIDNYNFSQDKASNKKLGLFSIIFLIIGILIGIIIGFAIKIYIENTELTKMLDKQNAIIDSITTTNNNNHENIVADSIYIESCSTSTSLIDNMDSIESSKTDTITKTCFLTTMARKHYGNLHFWVYIYEENKSKLGNPNAIRPGTIVVIPPASKYGIDANNPQSVEIAKQKAIEIYSKYTN